MNTELIDLNDLETISSEINEFDGTLSERDWRFFEVEYDLWVERNNLNG